MNFEYVGFVRISITIQKLKINITDLVNARAPILSQCLLYKSETNEELKFENVELENNTTSNQDNLNLEDLNF